MIEFTVGEYPLKNGLKAVVSFEINNQSTINEYVLGGYIVLPDGAETIVEWTKSGSSSLWGSAYDLMPRKKKLESWGFIYYQEGEKQTTIGDSEQSERNLRNYFANTLGLNCSEVFKYPDLEIEE